MKQLFGGVAGLGLLAVVVGLGNVVYGTQKQFDHGIFPVCVALTGFGALFVAFGLVWMLLKHRKKVR